MSNYCVLDINKIKSRALLQTVYNHNKRISHPINAAEEIADKNEEWLIPGASDLADALDQKIASLPYYKDHKLYKNAVLAYELVMTYTPDAAGTFDEEAWKKENLKWLQETFDRNKDKYGTNIISIDYHYDEGSATVAGKTHCHAVVLPVDDRGHFNASYYTGSPIRMRALQDSYAEHMKQFGLERGRAYEASPHERVKMFYSRLNAESARPIPTAQKTNLFISTKNALPVFLNWNAWQISNPLQTKIKKYGKSRAHIVRMSKETVSFISSREILQPIAKNAKAWSTNLAACTL